MDDTITATSDAGDTPRPRRRRRVAALAGGSALLAGLGGGTFALVAGTGGLSSAATTLDATTKPSTSSPAPQSLPRADAGRLAFGRDGRGWAPGDLVVGLLTNVGTSSLTVQTPSGTSVQVQVNSSTTYQEGRSSLTLGKLSSGQDVAIVPTSATAGTSSPVASSVRVVGPMVAGRVVSQSGSTIVVSDAQGFYRTIVTSSSTTVTTTSGTSGTLGSVTAGTRIAALGTIAADHTTLDATTIHLLPASSTAAKGRWGGPGAVDPGGPLRSVGRGGFGGPGDFGPGGRPGMLG